MTSQVPGLGIHTAGGQREDEDQPETEPGVRNRSARRQRLAGKRPCARASSASMSPSTVKMRIPRPKSPYTEMTEPLISLTNAWLTISWPEGVERVSHDGTRPVAGLSGWWCRAPSELLNSTGYLNLTTIRGEGEPGHSSLEVDRANCYRVRGPVMHHERNRDGPARNDLDRVSLGGAGQIGAVDTGVQRYGAGGRGW